MSESATIKVPKDLRDSVMKAARTEGMTAAEYLRLVTNEHARRQRFDRVRAAYARAADAPDDDYDDLTAAWDEAAGDGLDDA
ncbi:hypothetical protein [Microlunatus speluncae]|uniref:hypothetical protein n=1 Tax=Microlunatus speluncae TaxID=2594267 RepID=UPI00126677D3|nr:hypothetical protein [Microlunatus speluncae]